MISIRVNGWSWQLFVFLLPCWLTSALPGAALFCSAQSPSREDALQTAKKATRFLTDEVSTRGGYLWRYASDLSLREGEGVVESETVWVQPPGTPAVGDAFLDLFDATGDRQFLDAARAAGEALRLGQMESGGWQASVEFEASRRAKWRYRTNERSSRKAKDQSSLDDDKTQSALRMVIRLDRALQFADPQIHEMALYALDGLLEKGQLPCGGFPQVWTDVPQHPIATRESAGGEVSSKQTPTKATFPESWPWEYPGHGEYWYRVTLNDGLAPDVVETLLLADETYDDPRFRQAIERLGDFLVAAQLPEPQPAWAQQYSFGLQPIWARKFEPPAVTGGESQGVIKTLMQIHAITGEQKYLDPIPRALDYLAASRLPDGRLARFYEMKTNRPLYFNLKYELTYDDSSMPTHYSFKVSDGTARLGREFERVKGMTAEELQRWIKPSAKVPSPKQVGQVITSIDPRGAWVSNEGLRYHRKPGPVIDMRVAVQNLKSLASYLADE